MRSGLHIRVVMTFVCLSTKIIGQINNDSTQYYLPTNCQIDKAVGITDEVKIQLVDFNEYGTIDSTLLNKELWYFVRPIAELPDIEFIIEEGIHHLDVYGPFEDDFLIAKDQIDSSYVEPIFHFETGLDSIEQSQIVENITEQGLYVMRIGSVESLATVEIVPQQSLKTVVNNRLVLNSPKSCTNCIDGEIPQPGKYILSAWVSMDGQLPQVTHYIGPEIKVVTSAGTQTITPGTDYYIIDEWQLVEKTFEMPVGSSIFNIELHCQPATEGNCFFDDIRFFPYDSSMKTYVYDPETLRLSAELDERHFSTIYEYDEDGQLKRIKKETERGVKTIQESTSKSSKTD